MRYACRAIRGLAFVLALAATLASPLARTAELGSQELARMRLEVLDVAEGLSQNTVTAIAQDSVGFLWVGTENGLNRFDGYRFTSYYRDRDRANGLQSDFIWDIVEDPSGDLWLATEGSGVVRWSRARNEFSSHRHDPKNPDTLSGDIVRSLHLDRRGRLWVGTRDHGLDLFDPKSGKVERLVGRPSLKALLDGASVNDLVETRDGHVWAATQRGLLRIDAEDFSVVRFHAKSAAAETTLPDDEVVTLREDGFGSLWVGTGRGGLSRIRLTEPNQAHHYRADAASATSLSDDNIQTLFEDDNGRLWIGTSNGLNLYDRESDSFRRFMPDKSNREGLRDGDIMSLHQDRSGMLWIGTRTAGLHKWNPRSWSLGHHDLAEIGETTVTAFARTPDEFLWIGSIEQGLLRFDIASGQTVRAAGLPRFPALSDDRVMSLLSTRDRKLWVGTLDGGLNIIDLARGRVRTLSTSSGPDALGANGVMSIYEDSAGRIWVGTFGGGLTVHQRDGTRLYASEHDKASPLAAARVTAFAEDAEGRMWVATDGAGICVLDRTFGLTWQFLATAARGANLGSDSVYDIHMSRQGQAWVGTAGGGLDIIEVRDGNFGKATISNRSRAENLPSNVVYGVYEDEAGRFWLSTNAGIARIDPVAGVTTTFHRAHGAQDEEFNYGAHLQTAAGELMFGGNSGFNLFRPGEVQESKFEAPIVLTSFEKFNAPVVSDGPLESLTHVMLGHSDDLVTFEFSALDFTSPQKNRYSYRLLGEDSPWIELGTTRRVTLPHPAAGEFELMVRATNSDGVSTGARRALTLSVAPPPWQTPFAYAMYAITACGLLAWAVWSIQRRSARASAYRAQLESEVRQRTIALQEANEKLATADRAKGQFLARMSHEVRTPINGVLGLIELLARGRLDPAERRSALLIRKSAQTLLTLVNDILDFSKAEVGQLKLDPTPCNLGNLVSELCALMSARLADKPVQLDCQIDASLPPALLADSLRLRQVATNLLGNAVKFTSRGSIKVSVKVLDLADAEARVRIEVADTGIGIPKEYREHLFESFSQAESCTARRYGGSGLGLAICRQLIDLMGGRIALEARPGGGTLAWFELVLPIADETAVTTSDLEALLVEPPSYAPLSLDILVVEDDSVNQEVAAGMLQLLGCRAAIASDGDEALRFHGQSRFDAILMDCHLPGQDGFAITRAIRSAEENSKRTPIIALTADTKEQVEERCLEAGIDNYLAKPLQLEQLHAALARIQETPTSRLIDHAVLDAMDRMTPAGKESLAGRVATLYCTSSRAQLRALESAIKTSDAGAVRAAAHALKSGSKNVGAVVVAELCAEIEALAGRDELTRAPEILAALAREHEATLRLLAGRSREAA